MCFFRLPVIQEQEDAIKEGFAEFRRLPLYATDTVREFDSIQADIRDRAMQGPVVGAMIDNAQLIEHRGQNRALELEAVASSLQALADQIGAPVMVLSQVTKDMAGDSHAKHSRALEDNATLVFDLERGEPGATLQEKKESPLIGVYVTKHRDGSLVAAECHGDFARKRIFGVKAKAALDAADGYTGRRHDE